MGRGRGKGEGVRGNLNIWLGRGLRWSLFAAAGFFLLSIVWVIAGRLIPPRGTLHMLAVELSGTAVTQDWVPLEAISPQLVRAVIAAEDSRFCDHRGFDLEQISNAVSDAKAGKRLRGASTLSQQTAKNVFLWHGRGPVRKGLEGWFTVLIELVWQKPHIMETYLNVAEWGDGLFGAEAAAQARFGKSARDLTAREAAMLAAVLPSPNKWRVDPPGPYVRKRTDTLLKRMRVVRIDGLDACVYPRR